LKSLFLNLKHIVSSLPKTGRIFLFLDYDGTLSPIVRNPNKAILPSKTRQILSKLVNNKRVVVSVVSGRMLSQVKALVGLKGIYYAGCHGLEIDRVGKSYLLPHLAKIKEQVSDIIGKLEIELKSIAGWEIEDKGIIFALHYRRVKNHDIEKLKYAFYSIVRGYLSEGDIVAARGKKVFEVRPALNWDKGRYCLYLMNKLKGKREKIVPVYIGDDVTDETAFKVLKEKGITVFVKGERKTSLAEYYLSSTNEVVKFLGQLNKLL